MSFLFGRNRTRPSTVDLPKQARDYVTKLDGPNGQAKVRSARHSTPDLIATPHNVTTFRHWTNSPVSLLNPMFFWRKTRRAKQMIGKMSADVMMTSAQVEELAKTLNQMKQILQGTGMPYASDPPTVSISNSFTTNTDLCRDRIDSRAAAPARHRRYRGGPAPPTREQHVAAAV